MRAQPKSVLIVEDDPVTLRLLAQALQYGGYAVDGASSGQAAIRALHIRRHDLVILDLMLPDMQGEVVASALNDTHHPAPPVLVVSAGSRLRDRAEMAGAVTYLTKPFDIDRLLSVVGSILDDPSAGGPGQA